MGDERRWRLYRAPVELRPVDSGEIIVKAPAEMSLPDLVQALIDGSAEWSWLKGRPGVETEVGRPRPLAASSPLHCEYVVTPDQAVHRVARWSLKTMERVGW